MTRLLLDEMLSDDIAQQLRDKGHDVLVVVADPGLVALPDSAVLGYATAENRMVVTKNIKDFIVLDAHYRAIGSPMPGWCWCPPRRSRKIATSPGHWSGPSTSSCRRAA